MIVVFLLFALGICCLIKGGDWFVDSAVEIANCSGLSQILIGSTIVSMATTLPELIVSSSASIYGETQMSVGNAVGSIICNTGLILSINAIFGKIKITDRSFSLKSVTLLCYLFVLIICSLDGVIVKYESVILICMMVFYLYNNITVASKNKKLTKTCKIRSNRSNADIKSIIVLFVLGISLILIGSKLVVNNGVRIAEYLKVPTAIISLTLIALGTSLPEFVTSISALIKGNEEIGLGNIIGANILNSTFVIGISGLFSDLDIIKQNLTLDMPVALLVSLVLIVPSVLIKRVSRIQGLILLSVYLSYIMTLFLKC